MAAPQGVSWIPIVSVVIPGSVIVWAALRFLLKPFMVWQHRTLGRSAFRREFAGMKNIQDDLGQIEAAVLEITARVNQLEGDMERATEVLRNIPEIGESARRSIDACHRVEEALGDMQKHMINVAQQLGQVQGNKNQFGGSL